MKGRLKPGTLVFRPAGSKYGHLIGVITNRRSAYTDTQRRHKFIGVRVWGLSAWVPQPDTVFGAYPDSLQVIDKTRVNKDIVNEVKLYK